MPINNFHKHINLFAPVFICLIFGTAAIGLFAFVFPDQLQVARAMTYEDCIQARESRVQESYPPVCITAEGRTFVKNLPKIKIPN